MSKTEAPGIRVYSAILWDIPWGASWESACKQAPATVGGMSLSHPSVCVNYGIGPMTCSTESGDIGGYLDCLHEHNLDGNGSHTDSDGPIRSQASVSPWPLGGGASGQILDSEQDTWKATLSSKVQARGVVQYRVGHGGVNMWGVFLVPDARCLP